MLHFVAPSAFLAHSAFLARVAFLDRSVFFARFEAALDQPWLVCIIIASRRHIGEETKLAFGNVQMSNVGYGSNALRLL